MKFFYLLFVIAGLSVNTQAQGVLTEYVLLQKANVTKAANGSFQKPDKFAPVRTLFLINDQSIGMYPGDKKGRGFGMITGGFIHVKKLKPRKGFESELSVDDIDEKPHDQVTPVRISVKRQPGKLNYQIIAEFPTHVVFYNAMTKWDYDLL